MTLGLCSFKITNLTIKKKFTVCLKVQSLSAHLVSVDPPVKKVGTPNTSQTQNQDVHQIFQKHLAQVAFREENLYMSSFEKVIGYYLFFLLQTVYGSSPHVSNSRPGGQIRPLVDLISARRIISNYY